MEIGKDAMQITGRCVFRKKSFLETKSPKMTGEECVLRGSVSARIMSISIPGKNINIDLRMEDVTKLLEATNTKYREIRLEEIKTRGAK